MNLEGETSRRKAPAAFRRGSQLLERLTQRIIQGMRVWVTVLLVGCSYHHGAVVSNEPQFPPCRALVTLPAGSPAPEIRWYGPGHEDEASRHYRHCRSVGPSVLATADRGTAGIDSIAIVSYNMELGGGEVVRLLDDLESGALAAGAPIRDYVVLLQETFREGARVPSEVPKGAWTARGKPHLPATGARLDVSAVAARFGLHWYYSPAMRAGTLRNPSGRAEDWGNAILSTVPLGSPAVVELPFGGSRRIAQLAVARGRASSGTPWSLELANAHFSVGPIGPSALSAIRARQARAMVAVLDRSPAVAFGGDLNAFSLTGTAESVQILRRAFPDSPAGDPAPTRGGQRLDYLLFRLPPGAGATSYRRLPSTYGSDHFPVMAWVRFEAPGS